MTNLFISLLKGLQIKVRFPYSWNNLEQNSSPTVIGLEGSSASSPHKSLFDSLILPQNNFDDQRIFQNILDPKRYLFSKQHCLPE